MLTSCYHRPQCAIKDNDEGPFFGAAGDDGDDDEGTDAAKRHRHSHKRHSQRHICIHFSRFVGVLFAHNSKDIYTHEPVVMLRGIATGTLAYMCLLF